MQSELDSHGSASSKPIKTEAMIAGFSLLIMLGSILATEIQDESCSQCIRVTKTGTVVTRTLMYYNVAPECVVELDPCVHNQTQYLRCKTQKNETECYEPLAVGPITSSIYVYGNKGGTAKKASERAHMFSLAQNRQGYIAHNSTRGTEKIHVCFDACIAISKGQGSNDQAGVTCGSLSWERAYLQEDKYLFQQAAGSNVGATKMELLVYQWGGRDTPI